MALDATARESNFRDSIIKYFVDAMVTIEKKQITFDTSLATPNLRNVKDINEWISVNFGDMSRGTMSSATLEIYCCTRQDNEGWRLVQLGDKLMGYLHDSTRTDGFARIPFYQSHPTDPWVLIGGILVTEVLEARQMLAKDETKYKAFDVQLRFASKV